MTGDVNGQSQYDLLLRIGIPLRLGEHEYRVRPRTMKRSREWLGQVTERIQTKVAGFDQVNSIGDVIATLGDATDDMLDLILAYDETSQLPDRGTLDDAAYPSQVTQAFTVLLEEAYPPFAISRRLVPADKAAAVIGQLLEYAMSRPPSPAPTRLPSPSGTSERPKTSKRRSPAASSSS